MRIASDRRPSLALAWALVSTGLLAQPATEVLRGEAAEDFLRRAEVRHLVTLERGVTRSHRALLLHDGIELRAAWKTIDEFAPIKDFHDGKPPEIGFRDSYESEIAAYELAKLLGLDLVPPTVERRIRGDRGSLQLWIDDAVTYAEWHRDTERRRRVAAEWHDQIATVKLLRQLTYDADYQNVSNIVIGPDDKVWAVDFSRAFRTQGELLAPDELDRFSRTLLDRLRELDAATVKTALGEWLSRRQQEALLERRDLILELARGRIAELGDEVVLYE